MAKKATQVLTESEQVLQQQVRQLFSAIPLSLFATLVNAGLLVSIQWTVVDRDYLLGWFILVLAVSLGRGVLAWLYARAADKVLNCRRWERRFNMGVLLMAVTWGSSSLFIFPQELAHQVLHVFVIAGMCAGAVGTLSYRKLPILLFLSLSLLPIIVQIFLIGGQIGLSMGVMSLVFFLIVTSSALRIYKDTELNIRLKSDALKREVALKESEERFRMIFESVPLGVLQYDVDGKVVAYNEALAMMLEVDFEAIKGMALFKLEDQALVEALMRAKNSEAAMYTGTIKAFSSVSDTEIRIYVRSITSFRDEVVGGVMVVEDITRDKQLERTKDEFIATVSHELRTPLTAIIGSLGLLRSGVLDDKREKSKLLLENAYRNSERLLLLINDILDVEKMQAGEMSFNMQSQSLYQLLEQAIQSSQGYGCHYEVEFVLKQGETDFEVRVDTHRMIQVMSNLLSNAAKFSPKGSVVEIDYARCDEWVRVSVTDHGEGIPDTFRDQIFQRFSQSDGSSVRKSGGTGLGLSIVRYIIEQHDGVVDYHSVLGEGTTFYFDLPIVAES